MKRAAEAAKAGALDELEAEQAGLKHATLASSVEVGAAGIDTMEDIMKQTPQTYVLTLNSPSRKALRVWTGRSIHALRHCSVQQLNHALRELQQRINDNDIEAPVPTPCASYSINRSR